MTVAIGFGLGFLCPILAAYILFTRWRRIQAIFRAGALTPEGVVPLFLVGWLAPLTLAGFVLGIEESWFGFGLVVLAGLPAFTVIVFVNIIYALGFASFARHIRVGRASSEGSAGGNQDNIGERTDGGVR